MNSESYRSNNAGRNVLTVIAAFMALLYIPATSAQSFPAFPGAEGFGADTVHARGKGVCTVTRLDDFDKGQRIKHLEEGQFRYCLARATIEGGGYILFDVSGVLELKRDAKVPSNVYIAGQTSPGGIAFVNKAIKIENAQNVVIRHVRHRGAGVKGDAFNVKNSHNVVIDHVSVSFFRDGAVDIVDNSHDITVQWSHMGDSVHSGSNNEPYHGQPNLLRTNVDRVTFHHNYYTHGHSRMPLVQFTCADGGVFQFSNNVIYNFRKYPTRLDAPNGLAEVIGNYYIPGRNSHGDSGKEGRPPVIGSNNFSVYVKDNIVESGIGHDASKMKGPDQGIDRGPPAVVTGSRNSDSVSDFMIMGVRDGMLGPEPGIFNLLKKPISTVPKIGTTKVRENVPIVLSRFGALPRDNTDKRLVRELAERSGEWRFIAPLDNNEYIHSKVTDSDADGLPDTFEDRHGKELLPNGYDLDARYENLEVYLNGLADELVSNAGKIKIELRQPRS